MTKLFSLKGKIQNYSWGGTQFIAELLSLKSREAKCAEYWLGAHAKAPSTLSTSEGDMSLDVFLKSDLNRTLGTKVAKEFGELPFLFKVLDVKNMLSIQVHPTKAEAEKGFELENVKDIPLDAPNRNYRDANHKPEIMVAISEFWLLHGFLPKDELTKRLSETPEFDELLSVFSAEGYYGLYKQVMEQTPEECNRILQPLIDRIMPSYRKAEFDKSNPDYWAAMAFEQFCGKGNLDKGIYSIYFFNIVMLNKGEGIFQDAGVPHAYLEGQNIELMANSDNVLRGGLTPKYIDVPELLKHMCYEEIIPNTILGEIQNDGLERKYKCHAPDFELSQINLEDSEKYLSKTKSAVILMVIHGRAEITEGNSMLVLEKGEAAFLTAESEYSITSMKSTTIYKATTLP